MKFVNLFKKNYKGWKHRIGTHISPRPDLFTLFFYHAIEEKQNKNNNKMLYEMVFLATDTQEIRISKFRVFILKVLKGGYEN